jgi:hypothetical protein
VEWWSFIDSARRLRLSRWPDKKEYKAPKTVNEIVSSPTGATRAMHGAHAASTNQLNDRVTRGGYQTAVKPCWMSPFCR